MEDLEWGSLKIGESNEDSPVLVELKKMAVLLNGVERVNNIIVDLGLEQVSMIPNPIVAYNRKLTKDDPFLDPKALV